MGSDSSSVSTISSTFFTAWASGQGPTGSPHVSSGSVRLRSGQVYRRSISRLYFTFTVTLPGWVNL